MRSLGLEIVHHHNVHATTTVESGDAPTVAQSTHFDARDRLAGRLDDTTVRQAATEESDQ